MTNRDLDQALGSTPPEFSRRIRQTLHTLEEESPVKKPVSHILLVAIITVLLVGAACALVITYGQDWYYNNRFTAYQENEPEKHQAIVDSLTTDIPQQSNAHPWITTTVQDVAWIPQQEMATLSIASRAVDANQDELHSTFNMDVDGSYTTEPDPDDEESRTVHYLWTEKGFGLPETGMDDSGHRLLLLTDNADIYIGEQGDAVLPLRSFDTFRSEDGTVVSVFEFDLSMLDAAAIKARYADQTYDSDYGISEEEWQQQIQEDMQYLLNNAEKTNAAMAANTDENGMLTLRYEYEVTPFANDTFMTDEAVSGQTVFQIKVK